jgi:putative heme iron utilization protein
VTPIAGEETLFASVMDEFGKKFDESMIAMLMRMSDFNLYELKTIAGEATFGFADAYSIGGSSMETLVPRRGGSGHRK